MARWKVWGRVELGTVEAGDKEHALVQAIARYPETVGVQSEASYRVEREEAAAGRRRAGRHGDGRMGAA